ncbi:MAG: ATP-binding cassette domain-containing protein [Propionibacteriales bacterium]|nr:ATP-binding cassette domain-containing protein [Propionibacteriales bacterium]
MSATLHAISVGASHGARQLFADLTWTVAPGDVWGLVGANGAGKSTLLGALAGRADGAELDGRITLAPPSATVGLLEQEPERFDGEDVVTFLRRRTGLARATAEMERLADAMAAAPEEGQVAEDYALALDRWLALGGADLDDRIGPVAADIGLRVALDATMTSLSGGEAARVGLAALLLQRYDILLLDEPTNDLDLAGLDRLERFVTESRAPLVVVSHDREFLARTTTGIVELDRIQQQVTVHEGGYESYLVERERARRRARQDYEDYQDKLDGLAQRARTQAAWADKGVRNARRKATDGDKHIIHAKVSRSEKQAAKVSQTERAIERLEEVAEPRKEWELQLTIASAPRSGTVVSTLDAAVVRRGLFTLGPITAQISFGDRIVITGANGAGNTTWHL